LTVKSNQAHKDDYPNDKIDQDEGYDVYDSCDFGMTESYSSLNLKVLIETSSINLYQDIIFEGKICSL
jgi:hypothetical protein